MVKSILLLLSILRITNGFAQDAYFNIQLGLANYQGDIQQKVYTTNNTGLHVGATISYAFSPRIAVRAGVGYGKVKASDAKNSNGKVNNINRNLSFENNIVELHAAVEMNLLDIEERGFTPYLFGGVALFSNKPYAYSKTGKKIFLQPLSTEGQGLIAYPNRKIYKTNQLSLPLGGGVKLDLSENVRIGFEVGIRKTFTDYIDDVSTTYPDELVLLSERGSQAVAFSYRGGELSGGSPFFPIQNTIRGNAKSKDWYYFSAVTIGIRMLGEAERNANTSKKRYIMGCPKNVW
jgi:opacity protein-like surface antigen